MSETIKMTHDKTDGDFEMHAEFIQNECGFRGELKAKHPGFVSFLDDVATYFRDSGGVNYVSMVGFHPDLGTLEITVQRISSSITPAVKAANLTKEVEVLKQRIAEMEAMLNEISADYCHLKLDEHRVPRSGEGGEVLNFYGRAKAWADQKEQRITELEGALRHIKRHIETTSPSMAHMSATWHIASKALGEDPEVGG